MTTYRITAPTGQKFDVTGDGTAEEALKHFQDNYTTAPRDENYGNEGHNRPLLHPDAQGGTLDRFGAAVSGATDTLRVDLNNAIKKVFPNDPNRRTLITGGAPPVIPQEVRDDAEASMQRSRNRSGQYEQTKDQLGTAGAVGDVVPELALTAIPLARTATATARVPMLARTLGRYAPAIGDIVANAGYSGGKKAASNYVNDRDVMEGVDDAALAGGGGAAAGRVLVRALGGLKPLISQSARTLVDKGVIPSPGQLFDGPIGNFVRNTEDRFAGYPGVGDVIQYARKRSVGDFNRAKIDDAIAPIGSTVGGAGIDAVEQAQQRISQTFERGLDGMQVTPQHVQTALLDSRQLLPSIPLIDRAQLAKVNNFINERMMPIMRKGGVDGQEAKRIDAELGHYARKFSRSVNPGDHPMGDAFDVLQGQWRGAMAKGASGDNYELVKAANSAYRNLLPLVKSADKAAAQGGVFTPNQLQRSLGPYAQKQSPFDKAAQDVLPGRVPDSGTAGRYLLGAALAGGAGITGPVAGATLAASILYTRAGSRLLLNGLPGLGKASLNYLGKLAPDKLVEELARMHQKYGYLREPIANAVRQAAAQGGRINATQPEEEMTP